MAEGNPLARLVAQQLLKSAGAYGATELLTLDDMGIRGDDLVIASVAASYRFKKVMQNWSCCKADGFDANKEIQTLWEKAKKDAANPRPYRGGEFNYPQDAFSDYDVAVSLAGVAQNINQNREARANLAKMMNDTRFMAELRKVLPDLPAPTGHEMLLTTQEKAVAKYLARAANRGLSLSDCQSA